MQIKFDSKDGLPLKKMLQLRNIVIVVRAVFHKGNLILSFSLMNVCIVNVRKQYKRFA